MNLDREVLKLNRDVVGIQIPSGTSGMLASGTEVVLMQKLGGNYTVYTHEGMMYRIDAKDADALNAGAGRDSAALVSDKNGAGSTNKTMEERVWDELRSCYDPEIPVNIVELGLIYHCKLEQNSDGTYRADVQMTLTAPGCGMGDVLKSDVLTKLRNLPGMESVNVDMVFEPAWDQSKMSEAAKLQLGLM
jgi:probable FeS assembly SUF system protein SufT